MEVEILKKVISLITLVKPVISVIFSHILKMEKISESLNKIINENSYDELFDLVNYVKEYTNLLLDTEGPIFDEVINMYLVNDHVRKSALFLMIDDPKGVRYGHDFDTLIKIRDKYFPKLYYHISNDQIMFYNDKKLGSKIRYAIGTKNSHTIGELLGYFSPGELGDYAIEHYVNGVQIFGQTSYTNVIDGVTVEEYAKKLADAITISLGKISGSHFKVTWSARKIEINDKTLPGLLWSESPILAKNNHDVANVYWNGNYTITADKIYDMTSDEFISEFPKHKMFWYTLALHCKHRIQAPLLPLPSEMHDKMEKIRNDLEKEYYSHYQ